MTIPAIGDGPPVLPAFVSVGMGIAGDDIVRTAHLLRTAADVDWVSDLAALYRQRLGDLARLVAAVGDRVEAAEVSVNNLSRLP